MFVITKKGKLEESSKKVSKETARTLLLYDLKTSFITNPIAPDVVQALKDTFENYKEFFEDDFIERVEAKILDYFLRNTIFVNENISLEELFNTFDESRGEIKEYYESLSRS